jgi:hypothetical protein
MAQEFVNQVVRHQQLSKAFAEQYRKLLADFETYLGAFRTEKLGAVFAVRRIQNDPPFLVIRSKWYSFSDPLNSRVLTVEPGGTGYLDSTAPLAGCVLMICSVGDYFEALSGRGRGPTAPLNYPWGLKFADLPGSSHGRRLDSVEGIDRFVLDELYLVEDKPDRWFRRPAAEPDLVPVDFGTYIAKLIAYTYHPIGVFDGLDFG